MVVSTRVEAEIPQWLTTRRWVHIGPCEALICVATLATRHPPGQYTTRQMRNCSLVNMGLLRPRVLNGSATLYICNLLTEFPSAQIQLLIVLASRATACEYHS